ncbi:BnaA10g28820D [Brassica napus]|uniref:BnaA10g28820D protein n=1 Tax=Brassica napus TaxID=3708 RepID=A0A078JMB9_BRANA|nr:BnaA10g28820D [Brassica napus]
METISSGRNVGSSSGGTGSKEIRTNTGEVKTASDNLPQQICLIEDTRMLSVEQVSVENGNNGGAHENVTAEDEGDDSDYDYNGWHDYCRNDCVTDDDDDFVEGPGKGRSGGQSGGKGIRRPGGIGGTGAAKLACEILDHPPDWTQK